MRTPTFEQCMAQAIEEYVRGWLDAQEHQAVAA